MSVSKLILYGKNLVFKKTDSNKLLLSNNINPTFTTNIYDQLAHVWELNEKSGTIALDSYGTSDMTIGSGVIMNYTLAKD